MEIALPDAEKRLPFLLGGTQVEKTHWVFEKKQR